VVNTALQKLRTINSATPESRVKIYMHHMHQFLEKYILMIILDWVELCTLRFRVRNKKMPEFQLRQVAVSDGTNNVQVDVENLASVYISLYHDTGAFVKAGFMQGDLKTNESLYTGSTYGDADLEGYLVGGGFEKNLNDGIFIRAEINYTLNLMISP
jgi:hypothetical protein